MPTPAGRDPDAVPSPADPALPTFCHSFDLTKRLTFPAGAIHTIPIPATPPSTSPFTSILHTLRQALSTTPPQTIHRIVIPGLLSPTTYPPHASSPRHVLQFLHGLRGLLRAHPGRGTALLGLPLALFPRAAGLTRWIELLSDGVVELAPLPHELDPGPGAGGAGAGEEKPQGVVRVHRVPVVSERGSGGGGEGAGTVDDLAFTVTRRRFRIEPWRLPPVGGEGEGKQGGEGSGKVAAADVDF